MSEKMRGESGIGINADDERPELSRDRLNYISPMLANDHGKRSAVIPSASAMVWKADISP
jgi:hypothetical protein